MHEQWEYKTEMIRIVFSSNKTVKQKMDEALALAGNGGWELVNCNFQNNGAYLMLVFKRKKNF